MLILPVVESPGERAAVEAHVDAFAGVWPAVRVPEVPTRLIEVDARSLGGNAGRVALYVLVGPVAQRCAPRIESARGETLAEITTDTRAEALDAYRHPFARLEVPNIFSEAA